MPEAEKEYDAAMKSYNRKGKAKGDPEPSPRMVEGEDENFLRFATALKMIVGRSIRRDRLPRIKLLLEKYLLVFAEVGDYYAPMIVDLMPVRFMGEGR